MEAVILAGGYGIRFLPITANKPKYMIKLLGKPILEHIVNRLVNGGVDDIIISTNRRFSSIKHYFGDGSNFDCSIRYAIENEPIGGVNSIKNAAICSNINEDFIVMLGDKLIEINYRTLMKFHTDKKSDVTLVLNTSNNTKDSDVVKLSKHGRVLNFEEKPKKLPKFKYYLSAGAYVFKKNALYAIDDTKFYDSLGSVFPDLLSKKLKLFGYINKDDFIDMRSPESYLNAQRTMLKGIKYISEKAAVNCKLGGNFWIGDDVIIGEDSIIENSVINQGSIIEKGSTVAESTIFKSQIKSDSSIIHSFIDSYCDIDKNSSVIGSVLGEGVYVGENSNLKGARIYPGIKILKRSRIDKKEIKMDI